MSIIKTFQENCKYADEVAKCFQLATKNHLDSYKFAQDFLNSHFGEVVLTNEWIKPYNSFAYMYDLLGDEIEFIEGESYDDYVMWMYGFLVKYWINRDNISPKAVWKILPIDKFEYSFDFYHTQGWNYIIDEALERYVKQNLSQK